MRCLFDLGSRSPKTALVAVPGNAVKEVTSTIAPVLLSQLLVIHRRRPCERLFISLLWRYAAEYITYSEGLLQPLICFSVT